MSILEAQIAHYRTPVGAPPDIESGLKTKLLAWEGRYQAVLKEHDLVDTGLSENDVGLIRADPQLDGLARKVHDELGSLASLRKDRPVEPLKHAFFSEWTAFSLFQSFHPSEGPSHKQNGQGQHRFVVSPAVEQVHGWSLQHTPPSAAAAFDPAHTPWS